MPPKLRGEKFPDFLKEGLPFVAHFLNVSPYKGEGAAFRVATPRFEGASVRACIGIGRCDGDWAGFFICGTEGESGFH
jgi:hypothetical protein